MDPRVLTRPLIGVLLGFLATADVGWAQDGGRRILSLPEAEEIALRSSPAIESANREFDVSRARKAQASHARYLPKVDLTNVWGPIPRQRGEFNEFGVLTSPDTSTGFSDLRFFTQIDFKFTQPLWTGGKISGLIAAAHSGVEAAEANISRQTNDVRLRVRKAYWALVLSHEMLQVVEDLMSEAEEARGKLDEKFDEGSDQVTQNDMFKFDIFEYEVNKRHRDALDKVEMARAALVAAMGLAEDFDFDIDTHVLEPLDVTLEDLPTYMNMALASRPEIQQLAAGIDAGASMVRVKKSEYLPQLFFGADVKLNRAPSRFDPKNPFFSNRTNFFRPGIVVGFNWNLNFSGTHDQVRLAEFELAKVSERQRPLRIGIGLNVRNAYLKTRQARANMEQSLSARRASENWFRAEVQTFDLGVGEVGDVVDAFRANSTMKAEHLRNIFELNVALAELSTAVGRDLYPR